MIVPTTLMCDVCGKTMFWAFADSPAEMRSHARTWGWETVEDQDYCPDHKKAVA